MSSVEGLGIWDLLGGFYRDLSTYSPDWVLIWLQILVGILSIGLVFSLVRSEARAIMVGIVLGMAMTVIVYAQFGFTRILGVGHILFWTPTLFYMMSLQGTASVVKTWFGRWLWLAIPAVVISLGFDYLDFARYWFGTRQPIGP